MRTEDSRGTRRWWKDIADELEAWKEDAGMGFALSELKQTRPPFDPSGGLGHLPTPGSRRGKWDQVRNLAGVGKEADLHPLRVFPVDKMRVVIDGHRRLEEHREAGRSGEAPVVFPGALHGGPLEGRLTELEGQAPTGARGEV